MLVAAAIIGGYMALNIGANDVANNMGPAVGGKVLTVTAAVVIACRFARAPVLFWLAAMSCKQWPKASLTRRWRYRDRFSKSDAQRPICRRAMD
jgi:hypothetical protein